MSDNSRTVALVTGATRGIGLETVRQLAASGMHVMLGARSMPDGEARADEMRDAGLAVEAIQIDLTDPATHDRAAALLAERFGRLDVLINNAGIFFDDTDGLPGMAEASAVKTLFETNFHGPLGVTKTLLPLLRRSAAGRIVFVSSTTGSLAANSNAELLGPEHKWIGYSASKASINMLVVQLAYELRDTPIKVNAVCPGIVRTEMNGGYGDIEVDEGAIASVRYATIGADGPSGGFFNAAGALPW